MSTSKKYDSPVTLGHPLPDINQCDGCKAAAPAEQPAARDYLDTLTAVLNAIGYTEEFAASHPDLKVSEGVKLFLAEQRVAIECQAHIGPDCTECGGTGFWSDSTPFRAGTKGGSDDA